MIFLVLGKDARVTEEREQGNCWLAKHVPGDILQGLTGDTRRHSERQIEN